MTTWIGSVIYQTALIGRLPQLSASKHLIDLVNLLLITNSRLGVDTGKVFPAFCTQSFRRVFQVHAVQLVERPPIAAQGLLLPGNPQVMQKRAVGSRRACAHLSDEGWLGTGRSDRRVGH